MSASSVASCRRVHEILAKDNYDKWSVVVRNHLEGKDLWDVVVNDNVHTEDFQGGDELSKKNAKALHIIQRSCETEVFAQIKHIKTAKDAWKHLSTSFGSDIQGSPDIFLIQGNPDIEQGVADQITVQLHRHVESGDWNAARALIDGNSEAIYSISSHRTVLHVAVIAGHEDIVSNLVSRGGDRLLKEPDKDGYTALALAAYLTDNTNIAKCMVESSTEEGIRNLLTKPTKNDEIPVLLAAAVGHRQMTRYLYDRTPPNMLFGENVRNGGLLLTRCIRAEIFDVALKLLQHDTSEQLPLTSESVDLRPLKALVRMPSAFPSGTRLGPTQQFIYNFLRLDAVRLSRGSDEITIEIVPCNSRDEGKQKNPCTDRLLGFVQVFFQRKLLLRIPGIRHLYDQKLTHHLVLQILNCFRVRIKKFNASQLQQSSAYDAMLMAAKHGIVEFIESMREANPGLLWAIDKNNRGIFSHAILNRRKEVFQLIDRENGRKEIIKSRPDVFGNNLLHLAAHLGPSSYLDRRSGAALQMQREIQWFKAVEGIVHPSCKEAKNADGKTPSELFTERHKELVKAGENWAKDTVRSFTIVGTLIITAMFSTAFNVPGGNKDGIPIFLRQHNNKFTAFIIVGATGLFTSSSSILFFIRILTSRFAEKDFLNILPWRLFWGLFFLLLSVLSMIVAFCLALSLMLKGYRGVQIGAISLASIPLVIFVPAQLRLLSMILKSTTRSNVFSSTKKENNVYKYSIRFG